VRRAVKIRVSSRNERLFPKFFGLSWRLCTSSTAYRKIVSSTMLLLNIPPLLRSQPRTLLVPVFLLCIPLYILLARASNGTRSRPWSPATQPQSTALPANSTRLGSPECGDHFQADYLRTFVSRAAPYCNAASTSRLTCLSHKIHEKWDVLCVTGPALLDADKKSIELECTLRDWTEEDNAREIPPFTQFGMYWYNTGPRAIFKDFVHLSDSGEPDAVPTSTQAEGFSVLVRREDNSQNLWHTMMEIMSMTMSLDILRETMNLQTGRPFFTDKHVESTQVLILDELPDGPYYDLWSLFAGRPPVRFSEMPSGSSTRTSLIFPLAGSSNPFWQAEWVKFNCGESVLLKTFSRRVLEFYNISDNLPRSERQLVLTLIDRKEKRRLLHKAEYFDAVQAKFPDVLVQIVDFAELALAEQIKVAHSTDILVGVHGAGLTHGIFLPPSSAVVEIQPPTLKHQGFDLMAQSLGHRYYGRHGSKHGSPDDNGDWQHDDVFVGRRVFLDVVSEAITNMQELKPG